MELISYEEEEKIKKIVTSSHEISGHGGFRKTYQQISFHYLGITEKIISKYFFCQDCNNYKKQTILRNVVPFEFFNPFDRIFIDIVEFRKFKDVNSNYSYFLNIIDHFSRYAWSYPIYQKSAHEVTESISDFLSKYQQISSIQSDNGREFVNSSLNALLSEKKIEFIHGTTFTPRHQ